MNSLSDGIRNAIAYIEANLTEPVRIEDIAAKAYVSPYYFQRMFHALCGIPVGVISAAADFPPPRRSLRNQGRVCWISH